MFVLSKMFCGGEEGTVSKDKATTWFNRFDDEGVFGKTGTERFDDH